MESKFVFDCVNKLKDLEKKYPDSKYQIKSTIDICEKLGKRYDKSEDKLNNFLKKEEDKIEKFKVKFTKFNNDKVFTGIIEQMKKIIKSSKIWQEGCKTRILDFNSSSNDSVNQLTKDLESPNNKGKYKELIKECMEKINKLTTDFNIDKIIRANQKIEQNKKLDELIKKFNEDQKDNQIDENEIDGFKFGNQNPKAVPKLNLYKELNLTVETPFGDVKTEVKVTPDDKNSKERVVIHEDEYKHLDRYEGCCKILDELSLEEQNSIANAMLEYVKSPPNKLFLEEDKKKISWIGNRSSLPSDTVAKKAAASLCGFIVFCEPFETRSMTGCRLGKESFKMIKKLCESVEKENEDNNENKRIKNLFSNIFVGKVPLYVPAKVAKEHGVPGGKKGMKLILSTFKTGKIKMSELMFLLSDKSRESVDKLEPTKWAESRLDSLINSIKKTSQTDYKYKDINGKPKPISAGGLLKKYNKKINDINKNDFTPSISDDVFNQLKAYCTLALKRKDAMINEDELPKPIIDDLKKRINTLMNNEYKNNITF